jgi:hypothetical protein
MKSNDPRFLFVFAIPAFGALAGVAARKLLALATAS